MTCPTCHDGLVFTKDSKGNERLYVCACPLGDKHRVSLFFPSDKNKERPVQIPTYKTKWKPKADWRIKED